MKKYITPILCSICLGFFMGIFLCKQYDTTLDIKTVFQRSEALYFLQIGVYSSLENMKNSTQNLSNYIYTEENNQYYVYVGMTTKEENVLKLKGFYEKNGYVIYSKQVEVENRDFIQFVKECDEMLLMAEEESAVLKIEQEVLAAYEKMVNKHESNNATQK